MTDTRAGLASYLRARRRFARLRGGDESPSLRSACLDYARAHSSLADAVWADGRVSGKRYTASVRPDGRLRVEPKKDGERAWKPSRSSLRPFTGF